MKVLDFLLSMGNEENYEERKVARTEGPIGVSTCYVTDEKCYETALFDANGVHPVARYETRESALTGHKRWVKFAKTGDGKKVKKLFWSDMPELDKAITLRAAKPSNKE